MNFNKAELEKLFSGIPKEKLEEAVKKADMLSKNDKIRNSFSKIPESKIKEMLSMISEKDKNKLESALKNRSNGEISELIKELKNNL